MIFHALIFVNEGQIEQFIETLGNYILAAIRNTDDENSGRLACGLVSDLSNYLEKNMSNYADGFM